MTEPTLEDELHAVIAVLDDAAVPYALCGGIAANLYRAGTRATDDVDLYIVCAAPELVSLARRFESAGWQAHPAWREAELLRLDREGHPRVDLLVAATDFERNAVERAVTFKLDEQEVRVLLAEDLIVFKLVAGRHHDYESVAAIVTTQGDKLDDEFVQEMLVELGCEGRWAMALEAAKRMKEDLG